MQEIDVHCKIDGNGTLTIATGHLRAPVEISVIYFRAGYTPTDYSSDTDYATRFRLEACRSVKCPSIPLQLAGSKKIQEYITHHNRLEVLLQNAQPDDLLTYNNQVVALIRSTWMDMWGLDSDGGAEKARIHANTTVLKPQREGGGNNVYRTQIPTHLDTLPIAEYEAWIAMELIRVPDMRSMMVRAGSGVPLASSTVSELGIYGWSLFATAGNIVDSGAGGWLLRTKGKESDEGGVAVGISVLDSLLLV